MNTVLTLKQMARWVFDLRIYFYDTNKRYIGSRELNEDETTPLNATNQPIELEDKHEAHFINGKWIVTEIKEPEDENDAGKVRFISHTDRDGKETILLNENVSFKLMSIEGYQTGISSAALYFPVKDTSKGMIRTIGNASVYNEADYYDIGLLDNLKKYKIRSKSGLYAVIYIKYQHNISRNCFQVIFGTKGIRETMSDDGQKNRAHIAFYPDGNGKFVRMAGYACTLENISRYDGQFKRIYPSIIKLRLHDFYDELNLEFECNNETRKVVFIKGEF